MINPKHDKFLQVYGAHFGALRDADGKGYWLAWIEKDTTSIDLVISVIEKLSLAFDDGKFAHKPKLGTFKRVYAEMGGKTRRGRQLRLATLP